MAHPLVVLLEGLEPGCVVLALAFLGVRHSCPEAARTRGPGYPRLCLTLDSCLVSLTTDVFFDFLFFFVEVNYANWGCGLFTRWGLQIRICVCRPAASGPSDPPALPALSGCCLSSAPKWTLASNASGRHCSDYSCHNSKALDELIEALACVTMQGCMHGCCSRREDGAKSGEISAQVSPTWNTSVGLSPPGRTGGPAPGPPCDRPSAAPRARGAAAGCPGTRFAARSGRRAPRRRVGRRRSSPPAQARRTGRPPGPPRPRP